MKFSTRNTYRTTCNGMSRNSTFSIKRILSVALFLSLLTPLFTSLKAQVGITAVPFLQIEPDSRAAGMGNASVAIADNASAIFWNPSGLAYQDGHQISITHANWLPNFNTDLFYDYLVGKYTVEGIGTIGAHITFLNLGEQQRRGPGGEDLGTFSSYEFAGGLSYGYRINKNWAVGSGFRFIYSNLASGTVGGQEISAGTSIGVDLSALYKTDKFDLGGRSAQVSAGFNLSNVGPGVQYSDQAQEDPLPTILRVGWSYTMELDEAGYNTITLAHDVSKIMARTEITVTENDTLYQPMGVFEALGNSWGSYEQFNGQEFETVSFAEQLMHGVGMEYWYDQKFAIRSGYYHEHEKNGDRQYVTLGAGLRYNLFGVDFSYIYSLAERHPLDGTMRFSVLLDF